MADRQKLKLLIAICDASEGERLAAALREAGALTSFLLPGMGTAKPDWLDYLGLTETHKSVAFATVAESQASAALRRVKAAFAANAHYMAFSIPINSVAGANAYRLLRGEED